ncbi:MAG: phosphatidylserine decarboxylase family protein [Candidatus Onthomorpha sp.]|nr:phosphatidylserine decarboxylase family protein [Bacteroidales bacterium]MDY3977450.1 phosphatidylserine decarboxylase family protein [Candidatus Onthomorpha sp.]MCI5716085.1 phosphatidylserine decarboxylase family protein [Bacteroidales bacterium]MCI6416358.1 phosphatidylserine decarboxylase family protein [Bacteroidales bacterium]MCI6644962.1 phosphatidylserine decarboxylase family protein [Bacteroidales bacterium]
MYIHKEGYKISAAAIAIAIGITSLLVFILDSWNVYWYILVAFVWILAGIVIRFFRIPKRELVHNANQIIASADGTIVVVEKVFEPEVLNQECIQISTFMSPNNVHVNRYPVGGKVVYTNYHSGKYLIAKHPKSSTLNERTTICIETESGQKVVVRQIAGALARRIVCYAKEGEQVTQGAELGFIKFGSRVDLFIPLDSTVHVDLEDKVKGGLSILASL